MRTSRGPIIADDFAVANEGCPARMSAMKRKKTSWSVYIVECADATLYTGVALSVADRIAAHNAGRGARYTRGRLPVVLRFRKSGLTRGEALRRERAIKRLTRAEKILLIEQRRMHEAKIRRARTSV